MEQVRELPVQASPRHAEPPMRPGKAATVVPLATLRTFRRLGSGAAGAGVRPIGVVPLAETVSAVICDLPPGTVPSGSASRTQALTIDGKPASGPAAAVWLATLSGGCRYLALVAIPAGDLVGCSLELHANDRLVGLWTPEHLEAPLRALHTLTDGVGDAERARVVRLVLTTGASLFKLQASPTFAATARHLADVARLPRLADALAIDVPGVGHLIAAKLPPGLAAQAPCTLVGIGADGITAIRRPPAMLHDAADGRVLVKVLPRTPVAPEVLVAADDPPWQMVDPRAKARRAELGWWLGQQPDPIRRFVIERLAGAGRARPTAARLLAELRCPDDRLPTLAVDYAARTASGVLAAMSVDDPGHLVRAIEVGHGGQRRAWRPAWLAQADGAIRHAHVHLPFAPTARRTDSCTFQLVLPSGRRLAAVTVRLDRAGSAVPPAFRVPPDDAAFGRVVRTLVAARVDASARNPLREVDIGAPPAAPQLSLLLPVPSAPDLLRTRIASIAADASRASVECVHVVPEGRSTDGILRLLADLHLVHGLTGRALVTAADSSPAEQLMVAARASRAPSALILAADVLVLERGWLTHWLRALAGKDASGMLGGLVVDGAGSILSAGCELQLTEGSVALTQADVVGLPASFVGGRRRCANRLPSADFVGLAPDALSVLRALTAPYEASSMLLAETSQELMAMGSPIATALDRRAVRLQPVASPERGPIEDSMAVAVDRALFMERLRLRRGALPAAHQTARDGASAAAPANRAAE